jgi:TetR/AcrR family transcriptional repressor of nem operon
MRPREFDPDEVLERALMAFWRLGYEGCSVADLVRATGLQKQSLYNAFGDKRALFAKALDRYAELSAAALAPLAKGDAGLADLRGYLEGTLETFRARRCGACFVVKTAFGPDIAEPRIRRAAFEAAREVREAFARVVAQAARAGELPRDTDAETAAAYLYSVLHGLSALARTGATPAAVSAVLDHAFATLGARS